MLSNQAPRTLVPCVPCARAFDQRALSVYNVASGGCLGSQRLLGIWTGAGASIARVAHDLDAEALSGPDSPGAFAVVDAISVELEQPRWPAPHGGNDLARRYRDPERWQRGIAIAKNNSSGSTTRGRLRPLTFFPAPKLVWPPCAVRQELRASVESTHKGRESCRPALATTDPACRVGVRTCRWRRERLNSLLTGQSKTLMPWRKSLCASGALPHMAIGVDHEAPLVSYAEAPHAAAAVEQLCHPPPFNVGGGGVHVCSSALTSWTIWWVASGAVNARVAAVRRTRDSSKATNSLGDGCPRCPCRG